MAPGQRSALEALWAWVGEAGGRALLLGGCVRDAALGGEVGDLDVEIFGVPPARLRSWLQGRFRADVVGRQFPVLRLQGLSIDVSLPRRRVAAGLGTPDFDADADPQVTAAEAAARRDFTLNAIGLDLRSGELVDPLGGLDDLAAGLLRHASERFDEDPLRVLRGMQLVARFELALTDATRQRCRALTPSGLARERVFGEWRRLLLEGARPSLGLQLLRDVDWLQHFPEIAALVDCPQDPVWHPEGDVFVHTQHALDAFAAARIGVSREDLIVGLAVLCHDFGKPATTRREAEHVTSKGHDALSAALCERFLARWCDERDLVAEVVGLVAAHLAPAQLHRDEAGDAAIRRLARRVGRIDRLVRVAAADHAGRPPLSEPFAAGDWLLARARALEVESAAPRPLVLGRHLVAEGRAPGPEFGPLLRACYEAQLAGAFATEREGVAYLRQLLGEARP